MRPPGLYEELVTRRLEAALEEIRGEGWRDEIDNLDPAEAPGVPVRFIQAGADDHNLTIRARFGWIVRLWSVARIPSEATCLRLGASDAPLQFVRRIAIRIKYPP